MQPLFDVGETLAHLIWLDGGNLLVAVGRHTHQLACWDMSAQRLTKVPRVLGHEVRFVAVHPDGRRLVTADYSDPRCRPPSPAQLWTVAPTGLTVESLPVVGHLHGGLTFTPDGSALVGSAPCEQVAPKQFVGQVRWWEFDAGRWGTGFVGHAGLVTHLQFTSDGCRLVTYGGDCYVRVWDVATRAEIGQRKVGRTFPPALALSPNAQLLVVAAPPEGFVLLNPEAGHKLGKPQRLDTLKRGNEPFSLATFAPDGHTLALVHGGYLHLGAPTTLRFTHLTELSAMTHVAFAPDGQSLAVADNRGHVGLLFPSTSGWVPSE